MRNSKNSGLEVVGTNSLSCDGTPAIVQSRRDGSTNIICEKYCAGDCLKTGRNEQTGPYYRVGYMLLQKGPEEIVYAGCKWKKDKTNL